jgi:predicted ribosome quality control (RQC) complex YloA/Tae2 family protein
MWTIVKYGLIALAVYGVVIFIYMIGQEKGKSSGDKNSTKETFEDEAESNIKSLKEARTKIDEVIDTLSKTITTVEKLETEDDAEDEQDETEEPVEKEDTEEDEEEEVKPKRKASKEAKETFTNNRRRRHVKERFMNYSGVQSPKFNNYMLL